MARWALPVVALLLLVSVAAWAVGEGSWECLWGTRCGVSGRSIQFVWASLDNTITATDINGSYCLTTGSAPATLAIPICDGAATASTNASVYYPFLGELIIYDCYLSFFNGNFTGANDVINLQLQWRDGTAVRADVGSMFAVHSPNWGGTCGTNCAQTAIAPVRWAVNEIITPTGPAGGLLTIQLDNTSSMTAVDDDLFLTVTCNASLRDV